jgi:hypothetical protein
MSFIVKMVGKSVLEKHIAKYEPADPVYEEYVGDDGKKHTRKVQSDLIVAVSD